jgi:hypothetical protein
MAATLTIELSNELFEQLERQAREKGTSPEALAAGYLASWLSPSSPEPFRRWVGALASGVTDASLRHDEYIGQALYEELGEKGSDGAIR